MKPTIEIYRTLLSRAGMNFWYVIEIMKSMKKHQVLPERYFLTYVEKIHTKAKQTIVQMVSGK